MLEPSTFAEDILAQARERGVAERLPANLQAQLQAACTLFELAAEDVRASEARALDADEFAIESLRAGLGRLLVAGASSVPGQEACPSERFLALVAAMLLEQAAEAVAALSPDARAAVAALLLKDFAKRCLVRGPDVRAH